MPKKWHIKDTEVIKPWYPQVTKDSDDLRNRIESNPMTLAFYNVTGLVNVKLVK